MKATRFLAFLLAFVLAFSSIGAADVSAAEMNEEVVQEIVEEEEAELPAEEPAEKEEAELPAEEPVTEEEVQILEEEPVAEDPVEEETTELQEEEPAEEKIVISEAVTVKEEAALTSTEESKPNVYISVKDAENDWSWLYDNETLGVTVSPENLPDDAVLEVLVGQITFLEDNSYEFVPYEGDEYYKFDADKNIITLYGSALVPAVQKAQTDGIAVRVIASQAEEELVNNTWWFEARNAWANYDFPYSFPGDEAMLVGEERHFDTTMWANYGDAENPDGTGKDVSILSVSLGQQYIYTDDGRAATDETIFTIEGDRNNGWQIKAEKLGNVDVVIEYEDVYGKTSTYKDLILFASTEYNRLDLDYEDGLGQMLRGTSKAIDTNLVRRFVDEEGNHCEEEYEGNYKLQLIAENEEYVTEYTTDCAKFEISSNGTEVNVSASEENYGGTQIHIRAVTADENEDWLGESRIDIDVCDSYFNILPTDLTNIKAGGTIHMENLVKLYQYKENIANPIDLLEEGNKYQHRIRLVWDEDVWTAVDDDELTPVLKRISNEGGEITVMAQYLEEDGIWYDYFGRNYWFDGLDCSVWMEELPGEDRDWIYADEDLTYEINTDNLIDAVDANVIVRVANPDENELNVLSEDAYTVGEENGKVTLTLHGEKIKEQLGEEDDCFFVQYSVYIEHDGEDHILFEGGRDMWLREKWDSYNLPGEWVSLLLGDEYYISRNMGAEYEDKDHPFREWTDVEVTDVEILRQREYNGEPEATPTGKSIISVYEDDNGWNLTAKDHGEADMRITYKNVYGEECEYYFTVTSAGDVITLKLDVQDDRVRMLQDSEVTIATQVVRRYIDGKDNQYQEILEDYTLTLPTEENSDATSFESELAVYSVNDQKELTIKSKADVSGDHWFYMEANGTYTDNNGDEQPFECGTNYCLEVNDEVYSMKLNNPDAISSVLNIEETLDLRSAEPEVWVQRNGEDAAKLSEEEVYFVVEDWDGNAWEEIAREDGEDSIILLKRTGTWETNLQLVARSTEDDNELARYRFEFTGIETRFKNLRGGGYTWVFTDEWTNKLDLDMRDFAGASDVEVEWTVGVMDDDGNFIDTASCAIIGAEDDGNKVAELMKTYQYVIDPDCLSISLNGGLLAEGFKNDENGGVTVQVIVKIDGKEVYRLDTWVELRDTVCRLEGEESSELLFWEGSGWVYDQNTIDAWVENGAYPYGKNVKLNIEDIVLDNHDDENPAFTLYTDRYTGYWNIYAERPGGATVKFIVSHGRIGEFEVVKDLYTSDEVYMLQAFSDTGTHMLLPGEKLNLITDFYLYKRDDKGNVVETYIPEDQYEVSIQADNGDLLICNPAEGTITASKYATGGTNVRVKVTFERENGDVDTREYPLWIEVSDHFITLNSETYFVEPNSIHDIDKLGINIVEKYYDENGELVVNTYDADKARFESVGNANYFWITWWNQKLAVNNKITREMPLDNRVYVVAEYDGMEYDGWVNVVVCEHNYETVVEKATTSANGCTYRKCSECGHEKDRKTIYAVNTVILSKSSLTYNGKEQKPTVTVKDSKGNKLSTGSYTVTYGSGCKNVGKYSVTVTLKGNYSGKLTTSFTILPKGTTISKLTAASKSFTAKWKKQATQTSGYEIQYSTSSNFSGAKTTAVKGASTVSKKITKLTGKKKYYVRIRTYKTVSGTKYYSEWSKVKKVTTKK